MVTDHPLIWALGSNCETKICLSDGVVVVELDCAYDLHFYKRMITNTNPPIPPSLLDMLVTIVWN